MSYEIETSDSIDFESDLTNLTDFIAEELRKEFVYEFCMEMIKTLSNIFRLQNIDIGNCFSFPLMQRVSSGSISKDGTKYVGIVEVDVLKEIGLSFIKTCYNGIFVINKNEKIEPKNKKRFLDFLLNVNTDDKNFKHYISMLSKILVEDDFSFILKKRPEWLIFI
jgi:hypothetical protein